MRQRPKQANYLDKMLERREVASKGIKQVRKEKSQGDKKNGSQAHVVAKRGKTNLIEKRHITPTSAQDYGWIQQEDDEGLNEGSKVSIIRSLDDIPDGLPASSIQDENQRHSAPNPASSSRILSLDDWGGNDNFWAQPSPKAKQIKSDFIEQQQSPRVVVYSKPGSDWGQEGADGANPNNTVSALTSLDDFPQEAYDASPRYEEVRGEHVPSGHNRAIRQAQQEGGGVIKQIAKMPTMQRMKPRAGSPAHQTAVDHGFSPPRRAMALPLNSMQREYKREYSPVEVPPLPVQQAKRLPDFPSVGRGSGRSNPGSGRAEPSPRMHQQFSKFRRGGFGGGEQEETDYEDVEVDSIVEPTVPSSRNKGVNPSPGREISPRSPRAIRQRQQLQRHTQQRPPRRDYFDDFDADSEGEPSYMGGGFGNNSPTSGKAAPGPYNQRILNMGVSASPQISMVSTVAPALPCEKPTEEVPEDQKLYYSKQPRHVEYVPGTLKDYKASKPKDYQEIPKKLKPDLNSETLKAKRANKERVKEFSENLQKFNKAEIRAHKKLPSSVESRDLELSTIKQMSKRERALEYGKKVPRPKASDASTITSKGDDYGQGNHGDAGKKRGNFESKLNVIYDEEDWNAKDDMADDEFLEAPDPSGLAFSAANKLSELEAKHNNSKRQIDAIKRSLKM